MSTIDPRLLDASIGLPSVWRETDGRWAFGETYGGGDVDLSDPQTAFGVALKLDAYETWNEEDEHTWCDLVAVDHASKVLQESMGARVARIGMVALLARARCPVVGKLEEIEWARDSRGWWRCEAYGADGMVYDGKPEWAPDIDDPQDALEYVFQLEGVTIPSQSQDDATSNAEDAL